MRLVLLPISTRRTLLYCIRESGGGGVGGGGSGEPAAEKEKIADRITKKAAKLWSDWEKKEAGWQRKVVEYGNYAFRRIPYQEWGLKSVPSLSRRARDVRLGGKETVDLVFPPSIIAPEKAEGILLKLGTEREALHKRKLLWCLIGMPITAPFALVPIIPNLPFFYLVYRAWSHRVAIKGGQHIQHLVQNKLISLAPSPLFDKIYSLGRPHYENPTQPEPPAIEKKTESTGKVPEADSPEELLVTRAMGKELGAAIDHPEIELEVERALWQVEKSVLADTTKERQ